MSKVELMEYVPIEKRTSQGTTVFRTMDHEVYARLEDGSIRRARPKVRGKLARKAEKLARRAGKNA